MKINLEISVKELATLLDMLSDDDEPSSRDVKIKASSSGDDDDELTDFIHEVVKDAQRIDESRVLEFAPCDNKSAKKILHAIIDKLYADGKD